jgi:hypothetical protein
MKVYCRYSGVEFEASYFRNLKGNKRVVGAHPMMYLPTRELIKRAADWTAGLLNEHERRILFVALLKATELVHEDRWECAVDPSDQLVQSNMERLLKFVYFKDSISSPQLVFHKIAITPATRELRGIKTWLDLWEEAIADWKRGFSKTNLQQKLAGREEVLTRLIKSSLLRNPAHYRNVLASWAMDAAAVPKHLRETFMDIMKVDPDSTELFSYTLPEIEQVVEYMEVHLEAGSIHTHAVLQHVRQLWQRNKLGLNYHIGMPGEDGPTFRIVEDEVETFNKEIMAEDAPETEPRKQDFVNPTAWLLAKMKWRVAQQQKEQREVQAKLQEDMLRKRADRITAIVDSNEDAEELPDA